MCICITLEVRGPAFRHVCKACYEIIKQSPADKCIADCHRLQPDTPYYVVCVLCYETIHDQIDIINQTPEQQQQTNLDGNSGVELVKKLKKAAKKAV